MATPLFPFLLFAFIFLQIPNKSSSSTCTLNFTQLPYEVHGECLGTTGHSISSSSMETCCQAALQPLYQSLSIRANKTGSIFIDPIQAQECTTAFQTLHNRTNLSKCKLYDFISVSKPNSCTSGVDSLMNALGKERYDDLQTNCGDLGGGGFGDDACFDCVSAYRKGLKSLKSGEAGKGCAEALFVSIASSNVGSEIWVSGIFSCLFDEIEFPFLIQNSKNGYLLGSKKLLIVLIVVASLVIIAPILYKITRKRLKDASEKDVDNLSVIVLKKTLEEEARSLFTCSDLYIFSQEEIQKATNSYNDLNMIGQGTMGKIYTGIMPSGMRATIKRLNDGINLHSFIDEICRKAKIRHPNLVGIMGYCDRGDQCLVYEYCANGNLAHWLHGDQRTSILTWENRLQIAIGVARGLWYLHHNPLEKTVHGDVKLTNILLNEKLEAKLSNSVLSKRSSKERNMSKSMANDVYGFGFILLELLTGRKSTSLVDEVKEIVLKRTSLSGVADPRLNGAFVTSEFRDVLSISVLCTTPKESQRPDMAQVLRKLEDTAILV